MQDKIGVVFVGCTHPHIFPRYELLRQRDDVELVGLYEPDEHLAQALSQRFGIPAVASAEEALDLPGVRMVVIEGWDTANPDYAMAALRRNLAVLLEKPGAPNLEAMHRLVQAASESHGIFQIAYMLRQSPVVPFLKKILQDDILGPITLARFHAASPVGCAAEIWQSVPGDLGGVIYTDGCHMVDTIYQLFGLPRSVKGMLLKLEKGPTVVANYFKPNTLSDLGGREEMPLGNLMFEDGGAAIFDYEDKLVTFDVTGWEAHPWVEAWKIEIYGTDGTVHAGLQPPWYKLYLQNPKPGWRLGWHTWEGFGVEGAGNSLVVDEGYTLEMEGFLRRIHAGDTNNQPWLAEADGVIAMLDAVFRSNKQNQAVSLQL